MIIVDSEETYSGLGLLLEKRGHRVIEVANDEQALSKLKQETPDLILMDTDMPPARSLVIARGLRERARLQEVVAIIIATSQKMARPQGGQTSMGHNDYVVYQGDFEQLKTILQNLQIETPALVATQTGNK
ncbi:MAG TPA: response regulator [Pyrinomonadaceae bacterium]|jgi:PleD family two-component response regulator|nr:response regulator [Pyrinomonadaceae bacterium]